MGEKKEKKSKKKKEKKEDEGEAEAEDAGSGGDEPAAAPKKGTGNVFALFNQSQITEFKEAFTMMDQDRDGIISEADLLAINQQLGREPDSKTLKEMLKESPGQLNFTHFLNLFGQHLHGTDPESALRDAFAMFDEDGCGTLDEEYFKDLMMNVGDQFSKDEIKQTWKEAPISGGKLDYKGFVTLIKRGKDEDLVA